MTKRKAKARTMKKPVVKVAVTANESESPFEKYRGIGNPGIPRGRKAIIRYIREMRATD